MSSKYDSDVPVILDLDEVEGIPEDELAPDSGDYRRHAAVLRKVQEQILEQTRRTLTNVRALVDTGEFSILPER